jgi:hypothetical protein
MKLCRPTEQTTLHDKIGGEGWFSFFVFQPLKGKHELRYMVRQLGLLVKARRLLVAMMVRK